MGVLSVNKVSKNAQGLLTSDIRLCYNMGVVMEKGVLQ